MIWECGCGRFIITDWPNCQVLNNSVYILRSSHSASLFLHPVPVSSSFAGLFGPVPSDSSQETLESGPGPWVMATGCQQSTDAGAKPFWRECLGNLERRYFPSCSLSASHSLGHVVYGVHWWATKLEAWESGELLGEVTALSHQTHLLKYYLLKPCCQHPLHGDKSLKLKGEKEGASHQRQHIFLQLLLTELSYHL